MEKKLMHPGELMVEFMNRVYRRKLTTTSGGNLSIRDSEGNAIDEPRTPQMQFTMQLPRQVPAHSLIRRSVDLSAK